MMKKTRLLPDRIKRLPVLPGSRSLTPAEFENLREKLFTEK
jgi:hypothetical protein